jgi:DNA-binding CsgD family transcriptional regulator
VLSWLLALCAVVGLIVPQGLDARGSSGGRSSGTRAKRVAALTVAERKIVAAVVHQRSAPNKVIAAALHISEHTLRNHLSTIYGKLGVNRRVDLVLYAMEHRLAQVSAGTH